MDRVSSSNIIVSDTKDQETLLLIHHMLDQPSLLLDHDCVVLFHELQLRNVSIADNETH
jgi:hypothetical protein